MPILKTSLFSLSMGLVMVSAAAAQETFRFPLIDGEVSEVGEEDEIVTDRDSFTPTTTTAGRGRTIVELAHSFVDNRSVPETHSYPELLFRQGVGDWFEWRVGWNAEVGGAGSPVSGNVPSDLSEEAFLERESRLLFGGKALLLEQDAWLPETSVILQGFTPTSGQSTATEMSATYVFGWQTEEGVVWDSALRYGTDRVEDDNFNSWSPSSVVKVPVGERWKAHAEYFGIFSDGRADETNQHFFSPGAHYLISPDLEIGVRVGWGLNREAANFFSNVGVGWRF